jgi:hypothetical protein
MSAENEKVSVYVVFGFQITRVSDADGELVTTEYAPGQEVELEAEIAREEEHRNRVRIVRPEPVVVAEPVVEAEPATPAES